MLSNTRYFQKFVISIFEKYTIFIYLNVFIEPHNGWSYCRLSWDLLKQSLIKTNLQLKFKTINFTRFTQNMRVVHFFAISTQSHSLYLSTYQCCLCTFPEKLYYERSCLMTTWNQWYKRIWYQAYWGFQLDTFSTLYLLVSQNCSAFYPRIFDSLNTRCMR